LVIIMGVMMAQRGLKLLNIEISTLLSAHSAQTSNSVSQSPGGIFQDKAVP